MVSLNVEEGGEIANNLLGIYVYLKKTLIEANIEKDKVKMEEVHKHLILLKDAWLEIEKTAEVNVQNKLPKEPITEGGISFTG